MEKHVLQEGLNNPVSRLTLIKEICRGKTVLDIGCVEHDLENVSNQTWLHQIIVDVAESVLGVDYLQEDIAKLKDRGYDMVSGDVTRPLAIDQKFDVIVIGNLIEHLSNFEGLFENISRLLKQHGCVLISTANPFYREQYFYSAFKNDILVNPEHTCWIDPVTLDQLAGRFGFSTERVYWVKEKWPLSRVILNGETRKFLMFTGRWEYINPPSVFESTISVGLEWIFTTFFPKALSERIIRRHGKEGTRRLLFLRAVGKIFGAWWFLYRLIIVTSPINRYELFVSVLKK